MCAGLRVLVRVPGLGVRAVCYVRFCVFGALLGACVWVCVCVCLAWLALLLAAGQKRQPSRRSRARGFRSLDRSRIRARNCRSSLSVLAGLLQRAERVWRIFIPSGMAWRLHTYSL